MFSLLHRLSSPVGCPQRSLRPYGQLILLITISSRHRHSTVWDHSAACCICSSLLRFADILAGTRYLSNILLRLKCILCIDADSLVYIVSHVLFYLSRER